MPFATSQESAIGGDGLPSARIIWHMRLLLPHNAEAWLVRVAAASAAASQREKNPTVAEDHEMLSLVFPHNDSL